MPDRSPLTPIFDPGVSYGAVLFPPRPAGPPPLLDVTDPFTALSNIVVIGDSLYISAPSDGVFYYVDKTDPSNLGTPDDFGTVDQRGIAAVGSNFWVVGGGELRAWSATIPAAPTLIGSSATGGAVANAPGMVAGSGPRIYLSNPAGDQIRNFNVSAAIPTLTSTLTNGTSLNGVVGLAFQGSHVYAAAELAGAVTSVNITVPGAMVVAHSLSHADLAGVTAVEINLQYVYACSPTGLVVIDKTTPTAMTYVTTVSIPYAVAVEVGSDHAYVLTNDGAGNGEVIFLDITAPGAPVVIPAATITVGGTDLAMDNDVLYVTSEGDGVVYAYDVSLYP